MESVQPYRARRSTAPPPSVAATSSSREAGPDERRAETPSVCLNRTRMEQSTRPAEGESRQARVMREPLRTPSSRFSAVRSSVLRPRPARPDWPGDPGCAPRPVPAPVPPTAVDQTALGGGGGRRSWFMERAAVDTEPAGAAGDAPSRRCAQAPSTASLLAPDPASTMAPGRCHRSLERGCRGRVGP